MIPVGRRWGSNASDFTGTGGNVTTGTAGGITREGAVIEGIAGSAGVDNPRALVSADVTMLAVPRLVFWSLGG